MEYKNVPGLIPTVAIGIPAYNGSKYIRDTLTSLLNQTFTDFRILICDDGSTDDTVAICREFSLRDPRVQVLINPERLGGAKNFNRTFELSRGKYFMWASQDDSFHPTFIEKCLAKLERSPKAVVALSEIFFIDEHGQPVPNSYENIGTEGMSVVERLHEVFCRTAWWAIYGLIRPEVLRKTKMYRSQFAGDVLLIAELLLHGEFVKVEEKLFYYRLRLEQPFTVEGNMNAIDHTKQAGPTPYTDLLRSIVNCICEYDLDSATKQQIIITLVKTLITENEPMLLHIFKENLSELLTVAVCSTDLRDERSIAAELMLRKCR